MTDAPQFESFLLQFQGMVFTTAMRLLGNQAEAEDIVQEVFLKAYERFSELRDNPRAGGWLKTVAINLCLNHLSRYRARWTFFGDWGRDDDDREFDPPAPESVSGEVAANDRRELIEEALRRLPAAQRVAIVLFHMEGLRYEEIAARLGVSLGKVKTDIFRGRESLRKQLAPRLREDFDLTL